jgi:signal transduction histidine kinase
VVLRRRPDQRDRLRRRRPATLQLAQARHALLLSRRRLADARDEERRALRRELHDGLGPALAGVGLGLRAARNRLAQSDASVAPLLDQLGVEIEHRVEEVRSLSRGLLPPTLGNAGLVPALDELTARYAVTGLDVSIDVLDGGVTDLSAEVTNAVYAIVAEAVRNVHRHAGARRCEVVLSLSSSGDGSLLVTVTDDGSGVDGSAVPGVGLTSMRERAEGLGGTFRFESRPLAGARVSVSVPQVALAAAS